MNRTLTTTLAGLGLVASFALAAPASATSGGGHGQTTQSPTTNGGGHAGRTPSTSGYCTDPDRDGTSTVSLPILSSPGGGQVDTLAAGKDFEFCSNTATVSGTATYVYGEYYKGTSWLHGWMNQGQFKRIVHIA